MRRKKGKSAVKSPNLLATSQRGKEPLRQLSWYKGNWFAVIKCPYCNLVSKYTVSKLLLNISPQVPCVYCEEKINMDDSIHLAWESYCLRQRGRNNS